MPRVYTVSFEAVSVTAIQDLVTIFGATGKSVKILRRWLASVSTTLPTAQSIEVHSAVLTTTTAGSGGTTPTPGRIDPGDAVASFTAHANDTTPTTGTLAANFPDGFHIYNRYDEVFTNPPVISSVTGNVEAFVLKLVVAPSGTLTLSGGVEVEESGG
jgi:hypothetical protein